ncbi:MAG: Hsp20/alpha crystallin family protein [Candidatus Bathyarchaeota archaeon]|jgi:HSP20 family protein|nr:Hsp20/alpha crystallin family protein [Candidatus Bathyarchaeota archaeon]MDP7207557.1 Hsp20/alpha crystallin family protein [Candidatus Bathyarchaeota archaeon]
MNFDEIVNEMKAFQRKIMESMLDDLGDLEQFKPLGGFKGINQRFRDQEKGFQSETPQGKWRVERINRPGVRGFIFRGMITQPELLKDPEDIIASPRPKPGSPRRPHFDIYAEKGHLRLYVELPGVDKDAINLEVVDGMLRLHAGDFEAEIELNRWIIDPDKMNTEYNNGVLEVTIPKEDLKE